MTEEIQAIPEIVGETIKSAVLLNRDEVLIEFASGKRVHFVANNAAGAGDCDPYIGIGHE